MKEEKKKKKKEKKRKKKEKCSEMLLYNILHYWVLLCFEGHLLVVFVIRDLCEIFMGVFIP